MAKIIIGIEFQNISCYCLSVEQLVEQLQTEIFQNISCYCLSIFKDLLFNSVPIFQNISCYCLSLSAYLYLHF